MERLLTEIILPDSQAKVILYSKMSNGEFRLLQRKISQSLQIELNDNKVSEIRDIAGEVAFDQQDFALDLIIKEIVDSLGVVVMDKKQFIYELSISDGDILYKEIDRITNEAYLSGPLKKK